MIVKDYLGGERIHVAGKIDVNDEVIKRAQDLLIARLVRRGMSYRTVSRILNVGSHEQIRKRFRAIPEDVRRHYERSALA
ncbi:MAG: hypothetical protein U0790_25180 [Isosphaeraceae bacterium]